jgi:gas vesicle protein
MTSTKTTPIAAFIIGGALGSLLGTLFAPHSGKVTRSRIKRKAEEARDEIVEKREMLEEKLKDTQQELKRLSNNAKDRLSE